MSSPGSVNVRRLGGILKGGAEDQVLESETRFGKASQSYWPIIRSMIVTDLNPKDAYEAAVQFFGRSKVRFAAVDGSEDQKLLGGVAVFWAGSTAATGEVAYHADAWPEVTYEAGFSGAVRSMASCIPIYVDSVVEVDAQAAFTHVGEDLTVSRRDTEQGIVDNSSIADWMMLFSELFLAYELAKSGEYQLILMDRCLSSTLSSLMYDTSKRALLRRRCTLRTLRIDGAEPLGEAELAFSRYMFLSQRGELPPRGDYLRYAIVHLARRAGKTLTVQEMASMLGLEGEGPIGRLKRTLSRAVEAGYLQEHGGGGYSLNPRFRDTWPRTRLLVERLGERFFKGDVRNPLRVAVDGEERWLTTLDLAFLCLFALNMLYEEAVQRRILLVGVTKDTAARDLISHLIPVGLAERVWAVGKFEPVATTDRMLLQAISLLHHEEVSVPWATAEYDTAFQTITPDLNHKAGYVSGAIRNRIIAEQRYVKCYVQLDKSEVDPMFRSNVLLVDRVYHGGFEEAPTFKLKHEYTRTVEESVHPVFWGLKSSAKNLLQVLMIATLKAMTQRSLPEVFGHNKALFIADKIVKAQRNIAARMVKATGHWLLTHPRLRTFSFYMSTFRARRSEVESARRRI